MISSGLKVPRPAIPIPAFDVPNAAPTATIPQPQQRSSQRPSVKMNQPTKGKDGKRTTEYHLHTS
jgi:hypothetical protein